MVAEVKKRKFGPKAYLLSLLALVVFAAIAALAYLVAKNYREVERFNEALDAYESENWELARKLLIETISVDPNNEDVFVKLAQLSEIRREWIEAGVFWVHAVRLNPFEQTYKDKQLEAFFRADEPGYVKAESMRMQPLQKDRHHLLLAFAYYQMQDVLNAKAQLEHLDDLDSLSTPLGELLSMYLEKEASLSEAELSKLKRLSESEDAGVAFHANYSVARHYLSNGEFAVAEDYLKKRVTLYPYKGSMSLASLYYMQGRVDDAKEFYADFLERLNPREAVRYAELLAGSNEIEKLGQLSKDYRTGSREAILAGYYMDVLIARLNKEPAVMAQKFDVIGDELPDTELAKLLAAENALFEKDLVQLLKVLRQVSFDGSETSEAYNELLHTRVLELMAAGDYATAAEIAEVVQSDDDLDRVFTLAIITDKLERDILKERDLLAALKSFPDEPRFVSLANDYYLGKGNLDEAEKYTEKLQSILPESDVARLQLVYLMETKGALTAAASEYRKVFYTTSGYNDLFLTYLAFCTRNALVEDLEALATFSMQNEEMQSGAAALVKAELANLNEDVSGVYGALEDLLASSEYAANAINPEIVYRAAFLLGSNDHAEAAVNAYEKLLGRYPGSIQIMVNLSELYADLGAQSSDPKQTRKALELANQAFVAAPDLSIATETYAQRLYENGNFKEAEKRLFNLVEREEASLRAQETWRLSMEAMIKALAASGETYQRTKLSETLLLIMPRNEVALQNIQSAKEEIRRASDAARQSTARPSTVEAP